MVDILGFDLLIVATLKSRI